MTDDLKAVTTGDDGSPEDSPPFDLQQAELRTQLQHTAAMIQCAIGFMMHRMGERSLTVLDEDVETFSSEHRVQAEAIPGGVTYSVVKRDET